MDETRIEKCDGSWSFGKVIRTEWAPILLALVVTWGFFKVMFFLFGNTVPEDSRERVNSMIDTLQTVWIWAMGFFFGTSYGNQRKTEMLAQSVPVQPKPKEVL